MTDITGLGKVAEQLPELTKEVRELITILFKPSVEEIGGVFGDYFQRIRQRNAIRGLEKTQKILVQRGIQPQPIKPKLLVPILEGMSLEEDEDLQTMWAKLLAEAIKTNDIRPSYSSILKELSPLDAQVLMLIYEKREQLFMSAKYRNKSFYQLFPEASKYSGRFSSIGIIKNSQKDHQYEIAKENLGRYGRNNFEFLIHIFHMQLKQPEHLIQESIDNLCYLGLCMIESKVVTNAKIINEQNNSHLSFNEDNFSNKLYLTYLGENFVSIVNKS